MKIKITIDNDRRQIPAVSQAVRNLCLIESAGDHPSLNKIELAVVELLTNIIDHGSLKPESEVNVNCRIESEVLTVEFTDNGLELSTEQRNNYLDDTVSMPVLGEGIDSLPVNGWGIQLIKSACDHLSYKRNGLCNEYTMVFDLSMAVS